MPSAPAATADWPTEPCEGRGCSALAIWATTTNLRAMPVDVEPVPDGNVLLSWVGGAVRAEVVGSRNQARLFGKAARKSHFVTCPAAADFRRPRGRR
jgi:hypothetical protein